MLRRPLATVVVSAFLVCSFAWPASTQSWPSRPVSIVVPFPAGGSTDIVARFMAERMRAIYNGASFVVENKPGATGNVATTAVAKAAPDGHTLLFSTSGPVATNVLIFKNPPIDPLKDLTPIALVAEVPLLIVVNSKLPIKNISELLAYDKANPGKLNFGNAGTGGMGHMASELLARMTGRKFVSVPYQGSAPVTRDLVAGMVDVSFDLAPTYLPHIRSGALRALAATTSKRIPDLPDVPTVAEQGIADYEASSFVALLGPPNLPADIIEKLNAAVNDWLKTNEAKSALANQSLLPLGGSPEMLRARMRKEIEKWGPVVKAAGISLGQ